IADAEQSLEGLWVGHATATYADEWDVAIEFDADLHWEGGGYGSFAPNDPNYPLQAMPVFNSGDANNDCPALATWQITDIGLSSLYADIGVPFYIPGYGCEKPAWQGKLTKVQVDAAGARAQFTFSTDGRVQIYYDLYRVCDP